jgi:hypothetical protein
MELGGDKLPSWARGGSKSAEGSDAAGAPGAGAGTGTGTRRSQVHTGILVLITVVTELVVIAAAANQWVSKKIVTDVANRVAFRFRFEQSWLTYNWRLTPQSHLTREWIAQLALDVATLVFSGLLVFALVRAVATTFWRMFFAVWLSVLAATVLGSVIRGLILPTSVGGLPGNDRATAAVFGTPGPSQYVVVGAATLGLLSAAIAGLVAVLVRRPGDAAHRDELPQASPYAQPEAPPPYYGEGNTMATPTPPWAHQPGEPHAARPAADQPTTAYQPQSGPWRQPPPPPGRFPTPPPPPPRQGE